MNKTLLIGGLAVLAAGAGAYFIFSGGDNRSAGSFLPLGAGQDQTQNQSQLAVNPSGAYTINELLAMNRPMKCAWKQSLEEGAEVTNIIYIDGEKFYQEVAMGDIGRAYTVSDGKYLYIWNDFTPAASKINIKEAEKQSQSGRQETSGAADLEQQRDFVCEKWTADNAKFVPPSGKQFADITEEMTQMMGDLQENSGEYKQQACDMCRQAPSPELVEECMRSMGCE